MCQPVRGAVTTAVHSGVDRGTTWWSHSFSPLGVTTMTPNSVAMYSWPSRSKAGLGGQPAEPGRRAHARVESGFRSGSRCWARPGGPRPAFGPVTTGVGERRRSKVGGAGGLSEIEAARLGLESLSERTLKRMAARHRDYGLVGLADGRWAGRAGGAPSVTAEVEEAIRALHEQCLRRSRISMASRERLVHQYVREVFPGRVVRVPHRTKLARVWRQWFGPGEARQRYVRSAAAVPAPAGGCGRFPAGTGGGAGLDSVAGEGSRRRLRHPHHGAPRPARGRRCGGRRNTRRLRPRDWWARMVRCRLFLAGAVPGVTVCGRRTRIGPRLLPLQ